MSSKRETYETPAVRDYGEVDELTRGVLAVNTQDTPLGAQVIEPVPPVNGS